MRSYCTTPSISAKSVWSLPIPTFTPGWTAVPRWRTRMEPAVTDWPPNRFTPSRLLWLSRPFRELPTPLLPCVSLALLVPVDDDLPALPVAHGAAHHRGAAHRGGPHGRPLVRGNHQ